MVIIICMVAVVARSWESYTRRVTGMGAAVAVVARS